MKQESCPLSTKLSGLGAHVISLPTVDIAPASFTKPDPAAFDWLFFTSANAIRLFLAHPPYPEKYPPVAVIGEATAEFLRQSNIEPAFVSPVFKASEAARVFISEYGEPGLRILWPCGNLASPEFKQILMDAGVIVTPCVVYETTPRKSFLPDEKSLLEPLPDVVTFTSPSTVEGWVQSGPPLPETTRIACIGPTTADAAYQHLGRVDIVAEPHTLEALAEAIDRYFTQKPDN